MKYLLILACCCGFLLTFATSVFAKSWNNISPLKTTRAEVIRLLGEPKTNGSIGGREHFEFEGDKVFFNWARGDCFNLGKVKINEKLAVADSLVYDIEVIPANINQSNYEVEILEFLTATKRSDCSGPRYGACGKGDPLIGFFYSRSERGITRLQYFGTEAETHDWVRSLKRCSQSGIRSPSS